MIVKRAGICGGEATIEGTRIAVADVVAQARASNGRTEYLAECFPHVSDAQVIEAFCYYVSNQAEVDDYLRRRREAYEAIIGRR